MQLAEFDSHCPISAGPSWPCPRFSAITVSPVLLRTFAIVIALKPSRSRCNLRLSAFILMTITRSYNHHRHDPARFLRHSLARRPHDPPHKLPRRPPQTVLKPS